MPFPPLQSKAAPFPFEAAAAVVEAELGRPAGELFEWLDAAGRPAPAGAPPPVVGVGSLGQVYRVRPQGTGTGDLADLALKVQRPGALETVQRDTDILQALLGAMPEEVGFREVAADVAGALLAELDYVQEAANAVEFSAIMDEVPEVVVPAPVPAFSGRRVLATEWAVGKTPTELVRDGDTDAVMAMTEVALKATMGQLLGTNVLHGDPHGGNLLFRRTPQGGPQLVYLDFGVLCRVSPRQARGLLIASAHIRNGRWTRLATSLQDMGVIGPDVDAAAVGLDLAAELGDSTDQEAINAAMLKLGVVHRFSFPAFYMLLARALAPLEGYGRQADPAFDVMAASYPSVMARLCFDNSPEGRDLVAELLLEPESGALDTAGLATLDADNLPALVGLTAQRRAASLRRALLKAKVANAAIGWGLFRGRVVAALRRAVVGLWADPDLSRQKLRRLGMVGSAWCASAVRTTASAGEALKLALLTTILAACTAAFTVEGLARRAWGRAWGRLAGAR